MLKNYRDALQNFGEREIERLTEREGGTMRERGRQREGQRGRVGLQKKNECKVCYMGQTKRGHCSK